MSAGKLNDRVAFDATTETRQPGGGFARSWTEVHACAAEMIYHRGGETVEAARLAGQAIFKVKILSCTAARAITTEYRMRDTRRGVTYNIREVDAVSDCQWVWLVVESGVAG